MFRMKKSMAAVALSLAALLATAGVGQTAHAAAANLQSIRLDGANREAVGKNVATRFFSSAKKAIIVNRDAFADAISATNLSEGKYPILYAKKGTLPKETVDALKSMEPSEVYIMGGTNSLAPAIEIQIKNAVTGVHVTRVEGADRYEVNAKTAKMKGSVDEIVVTTGVVYSDALIAAPYADQKDAAVVFTKNNKISSYVEKYVKEQGAGKNLTIIGGPRSVPASVESKLESWTKTAADRLTGENRYEVSANVAKNLFKGSKEAFIASGEVFSDALVAAAPAQKQDAPILLVRKTRVEPAVVDYLKDNDKLMTLYIMGGTSTIQKNLEDLLVNQIKDGGIGTVDPTFQDNPRRVVDIKTLPKEVQDKLPTLTKDMSTEGVKEFIASVNALRKKANQAPLVYDNNLSVEAAYRALYSSVTGELPMGGQYWSGDEYYRVVGGFLGNSNLQDNVNTFYQQAGGDSTVTNIGLVKYNGLWSFYLGGTHEAANKIGPYRGILEGAYNQDKMDEVFRLVNQERKSRGLSEVKLDPVLTKLAKSRAKETTGLSTHIRPDGLDYKVEFQETSMYKFMGEVLGSSETARQIVDGFLNHGPHASILLNARYTNAGVAAYVASDGRTYWDIVFAEQGSKYTKSFKLKDLSHLYRR